MGATRVFGLWDGSREGMGRWFSTLTERGLMFHPEDDSADILDVRTNRRVFSDEQSSELRDTLAEMFDRYGDDVCDAAYPAFMDAAGFSREG